jgi:glutamyl-tRNA(Gln) amidotransferase subunit D
LGSIGATEGAKLSVAAGGKKYTGTLMPHHDFSAEDVIVLKLKSGYNVGVRIDVDSRMEVLERPIPRERTEASVEPRAGLRNLVLIGTGGTIASYVDYRTGAVHPAFSASDLINAVPEIREVANMEARVLFSIFSENMDVGHWQELASAVAEEINRGADGVVIPHGTDTMGYTAAALSFMLGEVPKPVVLVGAQRSSDRPSSDAPSNLLASARFCASGERAGVFVIMHDTPGDDSFAAHIGPRVRKMHTSRRDAFRSINSPPAALIGGDGSIDFGPGRQVSRGKAVARTAMERKVVLLQSYPGMDPETFREIILGSRGVVIAGSGLGHVNGNMVPLIKEACDAGTVVVMTSQCISGSTNMNVYDTGRDLLSAGAISVADMLPETAYVKLMWALANSHDAEEAKRIMRTPLAGEMGDRRTIDV